MFSSLISPFVFRRLETGLSNSRQIAEVRLLAEDDSAHSEESDVPVRSTCSEATVALSDLARVLRQKVKLTPRLHLFFEGTTGIVRDALQFRAPLCVLLHEMSTLLFTFDDCLTSHCFVYLCLVVAPNLSAVQFAEWFNVLSRTACPKARAACDLLHRCAQWSQSQPANRATCQFDCSQSRGRPLAQPNPSCSCHSRRMSCG